MTLRRGIAELRREHEVKAEASGHDDDDRKEESEAKPKLPQVDRPNYLAILMGRVSGASWQAVFDLDNVPHTRDDVIELAWQHALGGTIRKEQLGPAEVKRLQDRIEEEIDTLNLRPLVPSLRAHAIRRR